MANNPSSFQQLLSLSSLSGQRDYLQSAGQLNEAGLLTLLEGAAAKMTSDIDTAAQLATIVRQLAPEIEPDSDNSLAPRATYMLAQTETIRGRHTESLTLIQSAQEQYVALGDQFGAWRTVVGQMNVLGELGRYSKALEVGGNTVSEIEANDEANDEADDEADEEMMQIACLIHINRGICFAGMGEYEWALEAYDTAEQFADSIPPIQREHLLGGNRRVVLTLLGRFDEALQEAQTAVDLWDETAHPVPRSKQLINLGFLYLQTGQYVESAQTLSTARTLTENIPETVETHTVWLNSAHVWLTLNLYPEALNGYQRAQVGLETANMPYELARAWRGLGIVYSATNQYTDAEIALNHAIGLFITLNNTPQQATTLIELAGLLLKQNRPDDALTAAEQAATLAQQERVPTVQFLAQLRLADLMIARAETESATRHLDTAATAITKLQLPHLLWMLRYRQGTVQRLSHNLDEAEKRYQQAISAIEQLRGALPQEALRTSFLQNKTAVYADLIDLYLEQDALTQAFALAEQAKARTLVDLMVGAVDDQLTAALSNEDTAELRTLRNALNALYNQLLSDEDDSRGIRTAIQSRAAELEQSIRHLHLKTSTTHPQLLHAALPFATLREQLPTDLPIIAYHIINGEILAFVYNTHQVRVVRDLASEQTVMTLLKKLTQRWNRLRLVHDLITPAELQRHERSAQRILHQLHTLLFEPIRPYLPPHTIDTIQPLVIVPHGVLHTLPFHALYDQNENAYLIDQYEMSYAPSVSVFALCQQQPCHVINNAHIIGVDDPSISHVTAEINAIAEQFPNAAVYTETNATRHAFEQINRATDLLHVASHGLFRADNPMFSALKLADGWLTAHDIMQLQHIPPLVALSACESGRGHVIAGDELLGLTRAFIGKGAVTLVATLWLVQDDVAAELMPTFYAQLKTLSPTAALRHAQLTIRETHPHPWYWATFQLIGKR